MPNVRMNTKTWLLLTLPLLTWSLWSCRTKIGVSSCVKREPTITKGPDGKDIWDGPVWRCAGSKWESAEAWKRGKRHGKQLYWHTWTHKVKKGKDTYYLRKKNILKRSESYNHGAPVGTFAHWYRDGKAKSRTSYQDGKLHGLEQRWHPSGTPAYRVRWVHGKKDGPEQKWHPNGKRKYKATWKMGRQIGDEVTWWPTGKKRESLHYKDGMRHGAYYRRNRDGSVTTGQYKHGMLQGRWLTKDKDGRKRLLEVYKRNTKVGIWKRWYPNGKLQKQWSHRMLSKSGPYIEWYPSGQKKREGSYLAYMADIPARPGHKRILSKKHGAWRTWTQDGKVKSTHYYHKGTRCRPPNAPKAAGTKTLPPCPPL